MRRDDSSTSAVCIPAARPPFMSVTGRSPTCRASLAGTPSARSVAEKACGLLKTVLLELVGSQEEEIESGYGWKLCRFDAHRGRLKIIAEFFQYLPLHH